MSNAGRGGDGEDWDSSPPLDPEISALLDDVVLALESGNMDAAVDLAQQAVLRAPDHPATVVLWAEVCRVAGDMEQAEACVRELLSDYPRHPGVRAMLGALCVDSFRLEEGRRHLGEALRSDPWHPEASYYRALLRERRGDHSGAGRDYYRAQQSDPDGWPAPIPLDVATIERLVEEAIVELHPSIQAYLSNVAIVLEDVPSEEVCLGFSPPMPPGEILGLFSGTPLTERSLDDPWSNLPPQILLFRCNLQRAAVNHDALLDELRITIFHEIGHFLGLSEQDLEDRGLH